MDELFGKLAERIEQTNKQYDMERIEKAYQLAKRAHEGTLRRSGEPYIVHPVSAAIILVELGMDTDSIVAALLHDVVEDTDVTLDEIKKEFGQEVSLLVDGVTKLGRIPFSSRERQQAENVRKMLLAMAQDVRVIIIKLADRLHNARTFGSLPDEKRRMKALETMEVYAPLAHRLGIRGVKEELEDISIKYLDPIAYADIEKQLDMRKEEREAFLQRIIARIQRRLDNEHIHAQIDGRVKSIYGIYRKVYMQGRNMDEIYDVYAVRIIVDTVLECYNILGVIHDMLQPIPNRFKDYISTPKQNMYQSLHTTVIDKEGIPFEVQIRTWDMHYTAEYGVAAHWKYKVGLAGKDSLEERLSWVRQLLESQKESDDVEDLVKSIKTDIAPEEVFVFTPKGDVITLPVDSTVIDFAYAIHSAVGNRMIGAKVDGRMVSLDFKVKTGMIVEVLTASGRGSGPSRDWLGIVRTSEARNKIRSWFKKEKRDENIQEGKSALDKEFRRNLISLSDSDKEAFIADIASRQRYNSVEDFYAAIGYGGLSLQKLIPRIREEFQRQYRTPTQNDPILLGKIPLNRRPAKASSGVIVEGLDGCLVKFARCCNPVPGDDIIGSDRQGLLADVSVALSNMRIPIHTLMAREAKDNHSHIQVTIGISDLEQLRGIMSNLKKISGVITVQRSNQPA